MREQLIIIQQDTEKFQLYKKHKSDMYNKSYVCKSLVHIKELDLEIINSKSKREFILHYKKAIFSW